MGGKRVNMFNSSFENIIQWLQSAGHLSAGEAEYLLDPQNAVAPPEEENSVERAWYVKVLSGISAWVAAIFLIGGVLGFAFLTPAPVQLAAGVAILVGAVMLNRAKYRSIFWQQFAFALSLTGQGLFMTGLFQLFDSNRPSTILALIMLIMQSALFVIYRNGVHRFLSVIFASVAAMTLIADLVTAGGLWGSGSEQVLESLGPIFLAVFAAGVYLVWQNRTRIIASDRHEYHSPLGFGLVVVMFGLALLTLLDSIGDSSTEPVWWIASIAAALLLAHFAIQTLSELGGSGGRSVAAKIVIIVAIGLLLIPTYNTPGIWAALLAMLLGFRHNHQLLLWFAGLFLLGFIGLYYYSLNITLLNKSYVLVGSGLILLAVRFVLGRLWMDRDDGLSAQAQKMEEASI